jgi:hypothetical protein
MSNGLYLCSQAILGEQKVDLLVDNKTKRKEIFEIAKKEGILL